MLRGLQLSFTPDVAPYPLENPSLGEATSTTSGIATITRTEPAGNEQIIFADYGSGIEQPHISESLLPPESTPQPPKRQRRHSPKGKASGTIKERKGNTKRDRPSISYFYEWLDAGKKRTIYIPVKQVDQVRAMIDARCSVDEILATIEKRPKETLNQAFEAITSATNTRKIPQL
ncbi:MAG: hypothetical protein SFY66_18465 [Oculatellaceae cyanobacterium bins.114]|nr:hypothetical protein [Oculatellaceae cyanobacterium bins.114]